MALQEQRVDTDSIYLRLASGRSITLTRQQMRAFALTTTGTTAARRSAVAAWVKAQIVAALGAENVAEAGMALDSDLNGNVSRLEVG